ncbi:LemA family protein [Salinicoccus halitifaciens]|uniref:LemA protein n=1 Tax=Salinicoccus halitifaciens TaxID=1073415 RepID=A0ABV2EDY9_9STAP|nr:LemA family protein [Salinicoccus halitifaciens]MCD2137332.1 LemA family protein [Salinicoccus halitifaciens]
MRKLLLPIGIIVGLIIIFAILVVPRYNTLVNLDEDVLQAESNIQTQLQRRGDLIPNLVSTVQEYADLEQEIFTDIAEARSNITNADDMSEVSEADTEMRSALSRLIAVAEDYPELQASEQFTGLRDELAGAENRIAVARQDYNSTVQAFNRNVRTFPGNMIAGIFGFEEKPYFEADEESQEVPEVNFDSGGDESGDE